MRVVGMLVLVAASVIGASGTVNATVNAVELLGRNISQAQHRAPGDDCVPGKVKLEYDEAVLALGVAAGAVSSAASYVCAYDPDGVIQSFCDTIVKDAKRMQVYVENVLLPLTLEKCLTCEQLLQPIEAAGYLFEVVLQSLLVDCSYPRPNTTDTTKCAANHCNATACPVCCSQEGPPVNSTESCGKNYPTCFGYIAPIGNTPQFDGVCLNCSSKNFPNGNIPLLRLIEGAVAIIKDFVEGVWCPPRRGTPHL